MPIVIPQGVSVTVGDREITVKGPKGELTKKIAREIGITEENGQLVVAPKSTSRFARAMHGTTRALVSNMVLGVTDGWKKQLELVGTGYRAAVQGKKLVLNVGYSHPVEIDPPENVTFLVEKTIVTVEGIDRHMVGQVAANIRKVRPPEPYKGKGIRYVGEEVRRKPGKAAKAAGAA